MQTVVYSVLLNTFPVLNYTFPSRYRRILGSLPSPTRCTYEGPGISAVNATLTRAGVADLLWAAPHSMRVLLSECVHPVFQQLLWLLPLDHYTRWLYLRRDSCSALTQQDMGHTTIQLHGLELGLWTRKTCSPIYCQSHQGGS